MDYGSRVLSSPPRTSPTRSGSPRAYPQELAGKHECGFTSISEPGSATRSSQSHRSPSDPASARAMSPLARTKSDGVDLHLPTSNNIGGKIYGALVRLPDVAGLPGALAIARSMRPFAGDRKPRDSYGSTNPRRPNALRPATSGCHSFSRVKSAG